MQYRKWSVPEDIAQKIDKVCRLLGYEKRGERWQVLNWLLEYIILHPGLFRKR